MTERTLITQKAQAFFEDLWKRGDPWKLESSEFERLKYERQIEILRERHYPRVLEIGCGVGSFTRSLARIADRIVALDISSTAIGHARAMGIDSVDFRVANTMEYEPADEGPWDLIVMSETIYYLGWLYSFFDIGWLATQLFAATRDGGQLLMANTYGGIDDYLLRPWLIRTYHDLFVNVGFEVEQSENFRGEKDGAAIEVLISLFVKATGEASAP